MSNNYAVINGKRVELTDEQVKALGIVTRKNPFERVVKEDAYYTVLSSGTVGRMEEYFDCQDDSQYDAANYFNDETFANQVALHQLLYRKLLKFAYDNGFEDTQEWNDSFSHYYLYYSHRERRVKVDANADSQKIGVYFSSKKAAERAIEEVVEPFMKEHPEFVW